MKRILSIGLIGVLLISISGCGKEPPKTEAASTANVEAKQVIEAFGTVKSTEVKTVTIDFATAVTKINVVEGQRVQAGDKLISLDSRNFQAQIRNKDLELKNLQLELSGLNRDYLTKGRSLAESSEPDLRRYSNDRIYAEDLLSKAREDLTAREALYQAGALSLSELNEFRNTVKEKEKSVRDASFSEANTRQKIQQELDQLKTSIEQKSLLITAKELDLQGMREKLNKSYLNGDEIIADVPSGVVTEIGCVQGDIITNDEGKKMLSILNKDSLVIEADVAEEFIKDVRIGAEVKINPQADKTRTYQGKVMSIAEKAVLKNNETVIPVRISVENPDSFLLPEYNVDVKIDFPSKTQS